MVVLDDAAKSVVAGVVDSIVPVAVAVAVVLLGGRLVGVVGYLLFACLVDFHALADLAAAARGVRAEEYFAVPSVAGENQRRISS